MKWINVAKWWDLKMSIYHGNRKRSLYSMRWTLSFRDWKLFPLLSFKRIRKKIGKEKKSNKNLLLFFLLSLWFITKKSTENMITLNDKKCPRSTQSFHADGFTFLCTVSSGESNSSHQLVCLCLSHTSEIQSTRIW